MGRIGVTPGFLVFESMVPFVAHQDFFRHCDNGNGTVRFIVIQETSSMGMVFHRSYTMERTWHI
jgi:hypothetical protein